jgi:D-threo-aldose 1-dehydrogenase
LSTKVGRVLQHQQDAPTEQYGYVDVLPYTQHFDYTRDGVLRSLEDSLTRMGVARIDIVYVHDIDAGTHGRAWPAHMRAMLDEGLPALAQAKAAGLIGAYGIGVNDVDICSTTLRHADLDLILLAGRYTLADQSALEQLLPECLRRDVSVVLGGPFNSGILATGARPADGSPPSFDYAPAAPAVVARVAAIEALCAAFDVPLKAAALQFPRAHRAVVNVLCGMRSIAEFDENHAAARFRIPAAFWQALRAKGLVHEAAPLPEGDA